MAVAKSALPKPRPRPAVRAAAPAGPGGGGPGRGAKIAGLAAKDPRFARVMSLLAVSAMAVKRHPPAAKKAAEAQAAAVSPPEERTAGAQANQVGVMKAAPEKQPEKSGFLAMLRQQIQSIMPKDLDSADKFMKGGEKEQIKGAVSGGVKDQKDEAAGPTQQAAAAAPDPAAVEPRQAAPMPGEPAPSAPPVPGAEAMPAPRGPEAVQPFEQSTQDADKKLVGADLDQSQLDEANDPRFTKVTSSRGALQKEAAAAPGQYRAAEAATLKAAGKEADDDAATGLHGMIATKGQTATAVKSRQQAAKERDEARRKAVADHIQGIYDRTKKRVEEKLDALEPEVMGLFDRGAEAALEAMKSSANREIDAFKDDRYSGARGKLRWIADKFRDVPPEIKEILKRARERFLQDMDGLAVRLAGLVDRRIAEAKAEIGRGEDEIKAYVAGLPKDLQAVGKAAAEQIASRFDELRSAVDDRQNALAQKLAQKFKEASDKSNEALKKLEEENKGFFKGLVDAIADVVQAIREFKDRLVAVFKKGVDTIMLIVKHPIRFLGHLLGALKLGFNRFVDHIWDHLKAGFMQWLFGSLAETGVEMPKDFSLGSLLKLVLQVLGITYDRMRAKAVKLVGERAVGILEKVFGFLHTLVTAGPAKMWEEMKEYLSDLKAQVIDALQSWVVTTVIKAAVTKLVTMFNPVGAVVQAIITIYNVVMFVIEQAKRILALLEAVVNSVAEIASGALDRAANWIEQSLARLVPVAIGLLARLLGLSGVTDKIKEIISKVQGMVDRAIDKVIAKVVAGVGKLLKAGKAAISNWWNTREKFTADDGVQHELFFTGSGRTAQLLLASDKAEPVEKKIAAAKPTAKLKGPALQAQKTLALQALQAVQAVEATAPERADPSDPVFAAFDAKLTHALKHLETALKPLGLGAPQATKVVHGADGKTRSKTVVADPLTNISGNTKGSDANASWIGWEYADAANSALQMVKYVRMHLLAARIHGPGTETWNLAPATQSANGLLKNRTEKPAGKDMEAGKTLRYEVTVGQYWAGNKGLESFAKKVNVQWVSDGVTAAFPIPEEPDPRDLLKPKVTVNSASMKVLVILGLSEEAAQVVLEARKGGGLNTGNYKARVNATSGSKTAKNEVLDAVATGLVRVP